MSVCVKVYSCMFFVSSWRPMAAWVCLEREREKRQEKVRDECRYWIHILKSGLICLILRIVLKCFLKFWVNDLHISIFFWVSFVFFLGLMGRERERENVREKVKERGEISNVQSLRSKKCWIFVKIWVLNWMLMVLKTGF